MSEQLSLFGEASEAPKSISEITRHIRTLLDRDRTLQDVWVEGEISNYTRASSGHLYFSLKDENAQLKCVMWKTEAARLNFEPEHGDQILAHGKIGVYEVQGAYQLYADSLQRAGLGDLHRRFEMLKTKLEAEGLFDSERKRPLPRFPRRIGIVTSPTAAGFQDVLNILSRRYAMGEVILSPAIVQGSAAPPRIIAAIEALNRRNDIDVMLIIRGGGSLEDLWCFNDENVVRAVAASRIPTVTGVGHEIDFTLVDFAADQRAPTPSAAAELVTPVSQEDLLYTVREFQKRMNGILRAEIENYQESLSNQRRTLRLLSPQHRIETLKQQLDDYTLRIA
ncbi:MAG TPA: exodeoxyribonuclease VII large subunit, partial [Aggregatilineales bacterium]|nr:exodeoxyribonuclease VII large subunit [Aggregatilineales bacterium]